MTKNELMKEAIKLQRIGTINDLFKEKGVITEEEYRAISRILTKREYDLMKKGKISADFGGGRIRG